MKGTIGFIVFVIVVVMVLYFVSEKSYPQIPGDAIHRSMNVNNSAACMECNGPGKKAALKEKHPPKFECFKCHKAARKTGSS